MNQNQPAASPSSEGAARAARRIYVHGASGHKTSKPTLLEVSGERAALKSL